MRRLEHADEDKFWEAWIKDDTILCYRFGKTGTQGQTRIKRHASHAEAEADLEDNVQRKIKEGFSDAKGAARAALAPGQEKKESAEPDGEADEDEADGDEGDEDEAPKPKAKPKKAATVAHVPLPEQISSARNAIEALHSALDKGHRSWKLRRLGRRTRHALERISGADPGKLGFGDAFDALMQDVVAEHRLPLEIAMELLLELDGAVFVRTVKRWKGASTAGPAEEAIAALVATTDAIHDADIALRVGAALAERHLDAASWRKRFNLVKPALEETLKKNGSTLARYLKSLDAKNDAVLASRVEEATR
jgi:predicted DNA-binding WGR domain protein